MEGQQNTSSQGTSLNQSGTSSSSVRKPKTFVDLDIAGVPIGDYAARFATRAGEIIRIHIPVSYPDWRGVPKIFKDDVWIALMGEFEFPVDHIRSIIESMFPPIWRRYKSDLRDRIRGKRRRKAPRRNAVEGSDVIEGEVEEPEPIVLTTELWEAARSNVPPGMANHIWEAFVDNEKSKAKLAKNAKNSESRKLSTIRHTTGRCSYSNKKYKQDESGIEVLPDNATDMWLRGHECSDGSVHPTAAEKHKKITEARERNKERGESGSNKIVSPELNEVFGANRKDGIRGYSSHMSKKQAEMAVVAQFVLQKRDTENETRLSKLQTEVTQVVGRLTEVGGKVDTLIHYLMKGKGTAAATSTPREVDIPSPEKGSSTFPDCQNGCVPENELSASNGPQAGQVELLNQAGKAVALGFIESGDVCHNRKVKPHEKKVYIEEVYEQTAAIWDGPQGDGYYTLKDIPLPTWLIWATNMLRPASSEV